MSHPCYLDQLNILCLNIANIKVLGLKTLTDLESYKIFEGTSPILPSHRNLEKDTVGYMLLMNEKTEFVRQAIVVDPFKTKYFAWIDFGIAYMFKDTQSTFDYLKMLSGASLVGDFLAIPGCWSKGYGLEYIYEIVNWRFCGSFFLGSKENIVMFDQKMREMLGALKKENKIMWEVNVWAKLEMEKNFQFDWYSADHNDSVIRIPSNYFLNGLPPTEANTKPTMLKLSDAVNLLSHFRQKLQYVNALDVFHQMSKLINDLSDQDYVNLLCDAHIDLITWIVTSASN